MQVWSNLSLQYNSSNDLGLKEGDEAPSPYILFGPHGYQTFPHSRCQEVPTVSVDMSELQGDWWLQEYINSHDGKPIGQSHTSLSCIIKKAKANGVSLFTTKIHYS